MRSSEGQYFERVDHLRGIAAFLVFIFHYIHQSGAISTNYVPNPFIMPLAQGHIGVSLFMVLSGYLFAKIIAGRDFHFLPFVWNRVLRLFPLLIFVCIIFAVNKIYKGENISGFLLELLQGFYLPVWPHGGWSIAVELHFYLLLPFLLFLGRKNNFALLGVIAVALILRTLYAQNNPDIGWLSYATIFGRIDQFVIGISIYQTFSKIKITTPVVIACTFMIGLFYQWLGAQGAFTDLISHQSSNPFWIILPTVEGAYFAIIILWYEKLEINIPLPLNKSMALLGTLSYSIYLTHQFFYMQLNYMMTHNVYAGSNFYIVLLCGLVSFVALLPFCYCVYNYIEKPFFKCRKIYIKSASEQKITNDAAAITNISGAEAK